MFEEAEFPNSIAMVRRVRGLSQAYIAEEIGVSRPKYIEIERGLKDITISQLEKLKQLLGAETEDLIGVRTGNFDFSSFTEKPNPPEALRQLGIHAFWNDEKQEWFVPADEVLAVISKH